IQRVLGHTNQSREIAGRQAAALPGVEQQQSLLGRQHRRRRRILLDELPPPDSARELGLSVHGLGGIGVCLSEDIGPFHPRPSDTRSRGRRGRGVGACSATASTSPGKLSCCKSRCSFNESDMLPSLYWEEGIALTN